MVVFIHAINYSPKYIVPEGFGAWLWGGISSLGNVAVPCFFTISGYLFYKNFTYKKLKDKLVRRIRTLIVPFIIWNSLIYFFYCFASRIPAFQMESVEISVVNYFVRVFNSVDSPLWFIRTLMVCVLITPFIVLSWRKRFIAIIWIVGLILTNYCGISTSIISNYYLPFYLIGAYMGKYHSDFVMNRHPKLIVLGCIGMALCAGIAFTWGFDISGHALYTVRLLGAMFLWLFMDIFSYSKSMHSCFQCSFAIYVMHCCIVKILKVICYSIMPHTVFFYSLQNIANVFITLVIILFLNIFMQKYCPKVWRFMLGGR